jgi:apolipoprotein N-acyltransferase
MIPPRSGSQPHPPAGGAADGPARPVPWQPRAWLGLLLAVVAGLGQAWSIAWPWSGQPLWWLQLGSLALLAFVVQRAARWQGAMLLGWSFAIAWLAGTWWWLFISMHVYGGLAAPLAALAVLALAAFLGSYTAAAAAVVRALGRAAGPWVFASAWLVAELMRARWFTGFPWGASGYAHVDGPLAFLAPWVGVYGISFTAAVLAWGVAALLGRRSAGEWRVPAGVAAAVLVGTFAPQPGSEGAGKLSVALLQGNIPQDEKFQGGSGIPLALDWYARQMRDSRASLTIAPETAIPLLPQQLPEGYLDALAQQATRGNRAVLVGIPLGGAEHGYTNSVIGLQPDAPVYRFDKHHLVPFGEFIPPLFRWFTDLMNIPLGDFNRGSVGQSSFVWQGQRLAPNVCYEDLFGEELGARFADEARAPTVFVNVSNIGWFGNTVAIDQHLHISRMRAIEFRRPVIRATNTGATAIIDHHGRVTHLLPRHTRGVLDGEVEGRTGVTPFAWWVARLGLWPVWVLGVGLPLVAWWRRARRARPSATAAHA